MRVEKVSSRQVIFLIIVSRITSTISFMPTIHKPPANQDIWLMCIISVFYTILLYFPMLFLTNKLNQFSIIGYMEIIFGKFIGKIIGILYGLFFVFETIFMINVQTQVVSTTLLVEASNLIIISIIVVVCLYIATRGLEVIGRASEFFGPITFAVIAVMLIAGFRNADFSVFLPIYKDSTFIDLNKGAIEEVFTFRPLALLTMIGPNLENKKEINSIFLKSIIFSMLIVILTVIFSQGTLGIEQAKHANFPFLTFTRLILTYGLVERIESVYVVTWIFANIIRVTGLIYISSRALREVLGKKENKVFTVIMGIIMGVIALYFSIKRPLLGVGNFYDRISNIFAPILLVILPLIAMIVYFFRRKSLQKKEKLQSQ